jgi:release factor glutamine methyltransferase
VGEARELSALDVGTGSGCIGLSLLREGPFARVVGTDPSAEALELARINAGLLGDEAGRFETRQGAGFEALGRDERFDVVVSNPPYVADGEAAELEPEVRDWEPASALFAGPGGFDVLDMLVAGAADHLTPGGLLAVEVGLGQAEPLCDRLKGTGHFASCSAHRDLTGRPRIVAARTA